MRNAIKYLASKQAVQLRAPMSAAKVVERDERLEKELEVVVRNMANKMFAELDSLPVIRQVV